MDRYLMLGLSTVFVLMIFFGFSFENDVDYDFTGIAYDVRDSSNGYTFSFDSSGGESFRCYSQFPPEELGYYALKGSFSKDGNIYFIKAIELLDNI